MAIFLVSGVSSDLTASESIKGSGSSLNSGGFTGFTIAEAMHDPKTGKPHVEGYVLVKGVMQYPNLNLMAETFADVLVYKALTCWIPSRSAIRIY